MAIPARLQSTLRPLGRLGKAIGPTGIGVLMSIGAHAMLIAASAQGSGSGSGGDGSGLFGAFDQDPNAEKIVPIVQLTPAERSRLPAFAQPRRDPLNPSSLGSLDLPPGLIAPSATLPGGRRTSVPAARMPSATTPRQFAATPPIDDVLKQIKARVAAAPTRPQPPASINVPRRTPTSAYIQTEPSVIVPPVGETSTSIPSPNTSGGAASLGRPSIGSGLPQVEPQSTEDILARLQGSQGQPATTPETTAGESENSSEPAITPEVDNQNSTEGIDIPIENSGSDDEVTTLALNPADGDASELKNELTHDARLTSEEDVAEKVEVWSASVVEQKGTLPQAETDVEINAAFKACRPIPPTDGLMGVVVNPGGEIDTLDVLKSTGYETLNIRAKEAVENYDFSEVNETTDYRVVVKVNYDAEGCVDTEGLRKRLLN